MAQPADEVGSPDPWTEPTVAQLDALDGVLRAIFQNQASLNRFLYLRVAVASADLPDTNSLEGAVFAAIQFLDARRSKFGPFHRALFDGYGAEPAVVHYQRRFSAFTESCSHRDGA